ncbi:SPOSA6832_05115 [Sporobolomyces salmonicolor]|uniref:SPOSA6832_05115-mRNA-1:cds n=1 Tax=Sporidiobolus salmonicolor TaxID=5005 RepID=A0A0D6ETW5_SPOSA|nr:SPOSA6832_05115 [Sporobolomyces salmonicolor]
MAAAPAANIANKSFLEVIKERRTIYALSKSSPISDERIVELVNTVVKHSPSSFNSQSSRAVVLLGKHHDKLWQFAKDQIKAIVPADAWPASEQRLNGFQGAYGTVLLFEDKETVEGLQKAVPLYAQHVSPFPPPFRAIKSGLRLRTSLILDFGPHDLPQFPTWSEHAHGILVQNLWAALCAEGVGANLQHYNPLLHSANPVPLHFRFQIDADIQKEWDIPATWILRAQLVIGTPAAPAGEKEFKPLEERVKVFQ